VLIGVYLARHFFDQMVVDTPDSPEVGDPEVFGSAPRLARHGPEHRYFDGGCRRPRSGSISGSLATGASSTRANFTTH